ncbi:MAG: ATPase [Ammonifex sp.]|jgi:MoxR-like ATPase|nr:MAG: ATPase [Ammonifex sp.]
MRNKFSAIENELNGSFKERRDETRGLLIGLLARQHVLLLGPPGTAKSAMVEDLCTRIGGRYFRWLLSKTTTPEELYGPVSLAALENDSYRRVTTGKAPEADLWFLDEIWKSNSAVLNMNLSALNERLFFNDGTPTMLPLQMAVGASNELPEGDELSALWDRFLLRYMVAYIRDPRNFAAMLTGNGGAASTRTTISMDELDSAQAAVAQVDIAKIVRHLAGLRQEMNKLHIPVSDRRWKQSLDLVKAHAWLQGRTEATEEDLEILAHALWQTPDQRVQVKQTIMALANPIVQAVNDLMDEAVETYQNAMAAPEDKATDAGRESNKKFKMVLHKLEGLLNDAQAKGKDTGRIQEAREQVASWNKEVVEKCLGI